jgi:hypothetical protein
VTDLERIVLARADEQVSSVRLDEPTTHDPWAIKPSEVQGRANGKGKAWRPAHCRACEKPATHGSYCKRHWSRVRIGLPVDNELYSVTAAERRRLTSGPRLGILFGRAASSSPGRGA